MALNINNKENYENFFSYNPNAPIPLSSLLRGNAPGVLIVGKQNVSELQGSTVLKLAAGIPSYEIETRGSDLLAQLDSFSTQIKSLKASNSDLQVKLDLLTKKHGEEIDLLKKKRAEELDSLKKELNSPEKKHAEEIESVKNQAQDAANKYAALETTVQRYRSTIGVVSETIGVVSEVIERNTTPTADRTRPTTTADQTPATTTRTPATTTADRTRPTTTANQTPATTTADQTPATTTADRTPATTTASARRSDRTRPEQQPRSGVTLLGKRLGQEETAQGPSTRPRKS